MVLSTCLLLHAFVFHNHSHSHSHSDLKSEGPGKLERRGEEAHPGAYLGRLLSPAGCISSPPLSIYLIQPLLPSIQKGGAGGKLLSLPHHLPSSKNDSDPGSSSRQQRYPETGPLRPLARGPSRGLRGIWGAGARHRGRDFHSDSIFGTGSVTHV